MVIFGIFMRAAMRQNPNMIRTMLLLSFTLIFLLAYAVYGATSDSGYYLYTTEKNNSDADLNSPSSFTPITQFTFFELGI